MRLYRSSQEEVLNMEFKRVVLDVHEALNSTFSTKTETLLLLHLAQLLHVQSYNKEKFDPTAYGID